MPKIRENCQNYLVDNLHKNYKVIQSNSQSNDHSKRMIIYEGDSFFWIVSILFLKSSSVRIFSSIFSTP